MSPAPALRRTLTRWTLLLSLFFLLLGGGVVGKRAFDQAQDLQDDTLEEIAGLIHSGQIAVHLAPTRLAPGGMPGNELDDEAITLQELGQPGHLGQLPTTLPAGLHTLNLNHETWRVIVVTQKNSQRRFAVAQQTELRDQIAWSSTLNLLIPMAALIAALLISIPWIIWRQFRPLSRLATALSNTQAIALTPIPEQNLPEEIQPFIQAINQLLTRTQTTLDKQQRFIADAAHELRTPIAALILQAENLANAPTEAARQARQAVLHQGLERLKILVVQLLDLARLHNEPSSAATPIALDALVREILLELLPLAEAAGLDLGVTELAACTVTNQAGRLKQLIQNALTNAIAYTPEGGQIDVALSIANHNAVLEVTDTGCGIADEELERVMQPFYRGRLNDVPGNGLGLAIAAEIAAQLGGTITLENRATGGLRFRYTQPLAP